MENQTSFAVEKSPQPNPAILQPEETAEQRIKQEVQRLSWADEKIKEISATCKDLKIRPLPAAEDKEAMKAFREEKETVRKTLTAVVTIRTGIDKKRKEINADYVKIKAGIDNEAKRLTALIVPIETPLKEAWDKSEKEEDDRKNESIRLEQEKLQGRVSDLLGAGIQFDGSFYSIGDISVDVVTLKTLPDEAFQNLKEKVLAAKKIVDDAKAEELRIQEENRKKEEEERLQLKKDQEELQRQRDELQKQQDELNKQKEDARNQAIQQRKISLEGMGLIWNSGFGGYTFQNASGAIEIKVDEITNASDEAWTTIYNNIAGLRKEINEKENSRLKEEEEKQRQKSLDQSRFNERLNILRGKNFVVFSELKTVAFAPGGYNEGFILTFLQVWQVKPEDWDKTLLQWVANANDVQLAHDQKKKLEEQKAENARIALMSEKERCAEFLKKFPNVSDYPKIDNPGLNSLMANLAKTYAATYEAVAAAQ